MPATSKETPTWGESRAGAAPATHKDHPRGHQTLSAHGSNPAKGTERPPVLPAPHGGKRRGLQSPPTPQRRGPRGHTEAAAAAPNRGASPRSPRGAPELAGRGGDPGAPATALPSPGDEPGRRRRAAPHLPRDCRRKRKPPHGAGPRVGRGCRAAGRGQHVAGSGAPGARGGGGAQGGGGGGWGVGRRPRGVPLGDNPPGYPPGTPPSSPGYNPRCAHILPPPRNPRVFLWRRTHFTPPRCPQHTLRVRALGAGARGGVGGGLWGAFAPRPPARTRGPRARASAHPGRAEGAVGRRHRARGWGGGLRGCPAGGAAAGGVSPGAVGIIIAVSAGAAAPLGFAGAGSSGGRGSRLAFPVCVFILCWGSASSFQQAAVARGHRGPRGDARAFF